MATTTAENVIIEKTKELCQAILDQPEFQAARQSIDTFMASEDTKSQYQLLSERGEYLQHKQSQGLTLSNEEVAEFEKLRESFFNNPIARGFLDAQQTVQKVQESVSQYVVKTFELGKVPDEDDIPSGSCGSGCGCHH